MSQLPLGSISIPANMVITDEEIMLLSISRGYKVNADDDPVVAQIREQEKEHARLSR